LRLAGKTINSVRSKLRWLCRGALHAPSQQCDGGCKLAEHLRFQLTIQAIPALATVVGRNQRSVKRTNCAEWWKSGNVRKIVGKRQTTFPYSSAGWKGLA
jgi:hypothetical protein